VVKLPSCPKTRSAVVSPLPPVASGESGAKYASAAGYDPRGLVTFFQKLAKGEGNATAVSKFLSDQPATPDRITHVEQYIAEHHLTATGGREPGALPAVQAKIRASGGGPPQPKGPQG
jgi:predicted Zn-dependent protease